MEKNRCLGKRVGTSGDFPGEVRLCLCVQVSHQAGEGQASNTRCDFWGCPAQGKELDSIILVGPFQARIFHNSMIQGTGSSSVIPPQGRAKLPALFHTVVVSDCSPCHCIPLVSCGVSQCQPWGCQTAAVPAGARDARHTFPGAGTSRGISVPQFPIPALAVPPFLPSWLRDHWEPRVEYNKNRALFWDKCNQS